MNRKDLLVAGSAGALLAAARPAVAAVPDAGAPLAPPKDRSTLAVAFLISPNANVMDVAGSWEVFQDAGFRPFLVSSSLEPVVATGGMKLLPEHTFESAPRANVIVVGAQHAPPEAIAWLRESAPKADVAMSVCTGAFQMAKTGLLDGLYATTHHEFYDKFAAQFPKVHLVRGMRYVENRRISCAGGLTSGIDLALRVVERYYGSAETQRLAYYLEYVRTARPLPAASAAAVSTAAAEVTAATA